MENLGKITWFKKAICDDTTLSERQIPIPYFLSKWTLCNSRECPHISNEKLGTDGVWNNWRVIWFELGKVILNVLKWMAILEDKGKLICGNNGV